MDQSAADNSERDLLHSQDSSVENVSRIGDARKHGDAGAECGEHEQVGAGRAVDL
jgi:hypothetical protein